MYFYSYSYFRRIARPPSQMVAETASTINSGHHKHKNRLIHTNWTTLNLGFSLNWLLLCYWAMVVGNNESTTTKNAGESLAISIIMAMQRYNTGHMARWSTSRASIEHTKCCHQSSACAVSPRGLPWSTNLNETHKTLTKDNFLASNYGTFDH